MQHPPAVRVGDRVADGDEPLDQAAELVRAPGGAGPPGPMKLLDRVLQGPAADEPHRVAGGAVAVVTQTVDGDDPRVFEPPRDLGLLEEPPLAVRVVDPLRLDELQRHVAVQILAMGHEDFAQSPLGMEAKFAVLRDAGG